MIKHILKQIHKQSALLASEAERIALELRDPTSPALLGKVGKNEPAVNDEIDDEIARFISKH